MKLKDFIEKIDDDTYIVVHNCFSEIKGYLGDVRDPIVSEFEYSEVNRVFINDKEYIDDSNEYIACLVIVVEG